MTFSISDIYTVPYARGFLPIKVFFKYHFNKLCFQLPQNAMSTDEITHTISARTDINEVRLAHHISREHGDLSFLMYFSK